MSLCHIDYKGYIKCSYWHPLFTSSVNIRNINKAHNAFHVAQQRLVVVCIKHACSHGRILSSLQPTKEIYL